MYIHNLTKITVQLQNTHNNNYDYRTILPSTQNLRVVHLRDWDRELDREGEQKKEKNHLKLKHILDNIKTDTMKAMTTKGYT